MLCLKMKGQLIFNYLDICRHGLYDGRMELKGWINETQSSSMCDATMKNNLRRQMERNIKPYIFLCVGVTMGYVASSLDKVGDE